MIWHEALHRLQGAAEPHVLASLVGTAGSTPREPGAKMVITADAVHDTLGGGSFEFQVIDAARQALAHGQPGTRLEAFPLGARSGQCCGGYVHVLLEVFPGAAMTVALFGAGHVGQELVRLMAPLPWRVLWHDSRRSAFPDWAADRPRLACHTAPRAEAAVAALPAGCHALVMTHDHAEDRALVDALLTRGDCASIGLIGSASKWASFRRRLSDAGHTADALERVRCPIGVPGAHGKLPYEIAVAVVAELLTLKPREARRDERGVDPGTLRAAFAPPPSAQPTPATASGDPT
ncbi:xanthine dehydrogenase accessory protein XdhC [Modicisalibacter tunisiensis]|uniref:Xanthine dehydrogenase accessory protein XdhC n=1 Tax=Modicisalibacter tunisiensis TaxID=390637 RepID=A0ABS7X196_9GAMM|nr:xanthine dehydrogenase accessory protein XdhC [Modicisalibacter tunisiensis]MBZ9568335.1 xanthine dehydrogenase accessory protein XdhC [Modicisalibacter tunisiensis]